MLDAILRVCWVLAATSFLAVTTAWALRHRSEWRWVALSGAAAVAVTVFLLRGPAVPVEWITALHEGTSATNVKQLYGRGAHAGPAFSSLISMWCGDDGIRLPEIVHLNLWLAGLNAALFFAISRRILGSAVGACLLTAVFVANGNNVNSALSELPSQAVTACALGAAPALALLDEQRPGRRILTWACLAYLGLLGVLMGGMRLETSVLGVFAVGAGILRLTLGDARIRGTARAAFDAIAEIVRRMDRRVLLVFAGVTLMTLRWSPRTAELRWAYDGLHPLNPSFLTLPIVLLFFLPLAVVVLIVLGFVHTSRDLLRSSLLPVAILVLYRTYLSAAHGWHSAFREVFRYLTAIVPLLLVLAAFGWRELRDLAARRSWPASWRLVALGALVLSLVVPPLPGAREQLLDGDRRADGAAPGPSELITGDTQLEVRYLLRLVNAHPSCTFVTPVTAAGHGADRGNGGFELLAFGRPVPQLRNLGTNLEQAMAAIGGSECIVFYRALDCNLAGAGCPGPRSSGEVLSELTFTPRPYSDVHEYGEPAGIVRLAAYVVRP